MSRRKTERLLSLVVCLLSTRRYLTAEQIRQAVAGYPEQPEAFKRMFERDKEELRELGIPLETGSLSPLDGEDIGYRVQQQAYELPELRLEADEAAVLGLAARVWRHAELAGAAAGALLKLRAAGIDTDDRDADAGARQGIEPRVHTTEPAFGPLWEAVRDRRPVTFAYRAAGRSEPQIRELEPWGVVNRHGRWYVAGRDRGRDAVRVFRLGRIEGDVCFSGPSGTVTVPAGTDVREVVRTWDSVPPRENTAVLRVRPGAGYGLRRYATSPPDADSSPARSVPSDSAQAVQPRPVQPRLAGTRSPCPTPTSGGSPTTSRPSVPMSWSPTRLTCAMRSSAGSRGCWREPAREGAGRARRPGGPRAPRGAGRARRPRGPRGPRESGAHGAAAVPGTAHRPRGQAATSAERLQRLLALVPYVVSRKAVGLADTATAFGLSERQLVDDLNLLWCVELRNPDPYCPIDLSYEGGEIVVSQAESMGRPLRLAVDEASALLVALRMLADIPGLEDRSALSRLIAKLEAAAGEAAGPSAQVAVQVDKPTGDQAIVQIRDALERKRRVHLRYYVPGRDEATQRDVDPMRLLVVEGRAYLEGWCRRAEGVRLFRLDRILGIDVLDVPAAVPEDAQPVDVDQGLFRPSADDVHVTIEVSAAGRWVAEYYPCESAEELGDGWLRIGLRTPDTRWVRRLALRLGEDGRVIAPEDLRGQIREDARAALAAYASG